MSTPKTKRRTPAKPREKRPGPAGGARATNRREVAGGLCEAALALFLAGGTEAVTIDQITARAGIAKGSFYRYAADKAALVAMIMAPVEAAVIGALDRCAAALDASTGGAGDATAIYVRLATELAQVVAGHAPRVLLYLQEARAAPSESRRSIHAIAGELAAHAVALTEVARDHGLIRDVDPRVSAIAVIGAVDALLYEQLRGRRSASEAPRVITELVGIVLGGVRRA